MRVGLIIAGGRSTRFGDEDKAVASLAGEPMIRRVADQIRPVIDRLVVNCREDQHAAIAEALSGYELPLRFAIDEEPDLGPVGGLAVGLHTVLMTWGDVPTFVVACDMPFVDAAIVEYLFTQLEGVDAAVPRLADGWFQPTHAVFRSGPMAAACQRAIAADRLRIVAPIEDLRSRTVPESELVAIGDMQSFENLNTREEFDAAAKQFGTD